MKETVSTESSQQVNSLVPFRRFVEQIIEPGLCTHCGTCVGLSKGNLSFSWGDHGPLPVQAKPEDVFLPETAWQACPGRGLDYPAINRHLYGHQPESWLVGQVEASYLAYSADPVIRREGASAGVITQVLAALVDRGELDGAVVLRHGYPKAWMSSPFIARTSEEILASSQSVYIPIPINVILDQITDFEGRLGYVGLPDQVASLRKLQQLGHPAANKIHLVVGPYVGTSMYHLALTSYLRSHGGYQLDDVAELRYREGEWPGHLMLRTKDGKTLRAAKFYYNYLIPFFITRSCLLTMDFTNELTDFSVGDAWSPELEAQGEGFSVVLARSKRARDLLQSLASEAVLIIEEISISDALSMHGHMLDFKKRGSFIRGQFRRWLGKAAPNFSLQPRSVGWTRYLVEFMISGLFVLGGTRFARWVMERIPSQILGPIFDKLRTSWKLITKPVKREGIWTLEFDVLSGDNEEGIPNG